MGISKRQDYPLRTPSVFPSRNETSVKLALSISETACMREAGTQHGGGPGAPEQGFLPRPGPVRVQPKLHWEDRGDSYTLNADCHSLCVHVSDDNNKSCPTEKIRQRQKQVKKKTAKDKSSHNYIRNLHNHITFITDAIYY